MQSADDSDSSFGPALKGGLRLRTLIILRWVAISGQITTIAVAIFWLDLRLSLGLCAVAIGASIIANLLSTGIFPRNRRLSDNEAMLVLQFDLAQLALLILATGGLTNPFALLLLAPVTISASALGLRSTLILGVSAVVLLTIAALFGQPILLADQTPLVLPELFRAGYWLAIVVGLIFLGFYSRRVALESQAMSGAFFATRMALAREQRMAHLGGIVAAAAHELGTPLATIKLVSTELMNDTDPDGDLHEDLRLIRDQADRCRDILHGMGEAGKEDPHLRQTPLGALLHEAAKPHQERGRTILYDLRPGPDQAASRQPIVPRRPEIIHGLRNLVQNAVDFARSTVWIEAEWRSDVIVVRVTDDGDGFPSHLIDRIGDPFLRSRRGAKEIGRSPEYEGMGLGLFIAKTLLERTGAELTFANGAEPQAEDDRPRRSGAVVEVIWPRSAIEIAPDGVGTAGTPALSR